jgi:ankyrin repeat protein
MLKLRKFSISRPKSSMLGPKLSLDQKGMGVVVLMLVASVAGIVFKAGRPISVQQKNLSLAEQMMEGIKPVAQAGIAEVSKAGTQLQLQTLVRPGEEAITLAQNTNSVDDLKQYIHQNPDLANTANEKGETALMVACQCDNIEAVKCLLENKTTNVNLKDKNKNTTLLRYMHTFSGKSKINANSQKIIDMLTDHPRINLEEEDADGFTFFMLLVKTEDVESVKRFLQSHKVNVNHKNKMNDSAYWMSSSSEMREILAKNGCSM